jgi:hypothetical protein
VSEVEELLLVLRVSCTILSQMIPGYTVRWKETRSGSIADINEVELAYQNTPRQIIRFGDHVMQLTFTSCD